MPQVFNLPNGRSKGRPAIIPKASLIHRTTCRLLTCPGATPRAAATCLGVFGWQVLDVRGAAA